MEPAPDAESR